MRWTRYLVTSLTAAMLAAASVSAQPAGSPGWATLTVAQRQALAPLERDWASIDPRRREKWLEIAARFPSMPAEERTRVQARMSEWARLSPQERGQARMQFQETRQVPPQERQARWQAYQALPPEQREQLQKRPEPPPPRAKPNDGRPAPKSNIVPNPNLRQPARAVAPTTVQAGPGATTTLITRPAQPPAHQQTGLPKIAATPGFVDSKTLLPKRGPQGAATRQATASEPAARR